MYSWLLCESSSTSSKFYPPKKGLSNWILYEVRHVPHSPESILSCSLYIQDCKKKPKRHRCLSKPLNLSVVYLWAKAGCEFKCTFMAFTGPVLSLLNQTCSPFPSLRQFPCQIQPSLWRLRLTMPVLDSQLTFKKKDYFMKNTIFLKIWEMWSRIAE